MVRTVKVAKPDNNQVKHLIPLELYCELNTPIINDEDSLSGDSDNQVEIFEPLDRV